VSDRVWLYTRPEVVYSAVTPVPMSLLSHEKPDPQRKRSVGALQRQYHRDYCTCEPL